MPQKYNPLKPLIFLGLRGLRLVLAVTRADMDSSPRLRRLHYADHLPVLQKACDWMKIDTGRAAQYKELIRGFFENGGRSPEHILAFNESCEIRDIYDLWKDRIKDFPGLEERIRRAFSKGPVIREGERPDRSTNRALP